MRGGQLKCEMNKNGMKKIKALVADDDNSNQMIHHRLLENLGIENQVVGNGREAIDIIHCYGEASFDLILMDMDMPLMNGIQATRELRGMGVQCGIVGVSTHSKEIEKEEFMEAGLDDYQQKPNLTTLKLLSILHDLNLQNNYRFIFFL